MVAGEGTQIVTSNIQFPVAEFRTKESFVRSRVQRYSVHDSRQISKQDGEATWCWVVHNKLAPGAKKVYTSTCFIQPSANK
uniref:VASt domain-containing protein n=1 Tax=Caenorhabditis tropicalis TaxID=1561998 RepID=A0A1I7THJ5_9PELO